MQIRQSQTDAPIAVRVLLSQTGRDDIDFGLRLRDRHAGRQPPHAAMALVLSGSVQMDTIIMLGCKPSSGYHTITKVDHNVVIENDGKPAIATVAEMLGPDSYRHCEEYPFFVTLGLNPGGQVRRLRRGGLRQRWSWG